jgi:hypothetical protein
MTEIHPNQMLCGDSIIDAFEKERKHHVLLLAQMQMGKTGTYWYALMKMLLDQSNRIDNVFIISGNRETELHQQVHDDKQAYRKWFFNQKHIFEGLSKKTIKDMKLKSKKNINIIWGGQLSKPIASNVVPHNSLIVWDEAHYAQSKNNAPDKFFKFNNLDTLVNGTVSPEEIDTRNIKLLNVSATPFSELLVNSKNKKESIHKVIKLEIGHNYYGMDHYLKNDLIHPSFCINDNTTDILKDILKKHIDVNNPKYTILRITDYKKSFKHVRSVCDDLQISVKTYNSVEKDIDLNDLMSKPSVPTVIIINGMLRMGKVIHKEHITMVFEEATIKNTKQTDTGFQGLLGRVCGYTSAPNGFDINVYIEPNVINEIEEYLKNYNTEHGPYCSKAMNTRIGVPHKSVKHSFAVIELPSSSNYLTKKKNICKSNVLSWLKIHHDTLDIADEQKLMLTNYLNSDKTIYTTKNLGSKSNSGLKETVLSTVLANCKRSRITIPENTCYLANLDEQIWIIFHDLEIIVEDKDNDDLYDDTFVLKKCVFKQP